MSSVSTISLCLLPAPLPLTLCASYLQTLWLTRLTLQHTRLFPTSSPRRSSPHPLPDGPGYVLQRKSRTQSTS
ncbi:hypothetical protein C8J57DRAFT_1271587 [Mycena rebaudengoi]|nr:hypothetical protein C8J57DRAFT_1271587 [Mycena rebaudengoi]